MQIQYKYSKKKTYSKWKIIQIQSYIWYLKKNAFLYDVPVNSKVTKEIKVQYFEKV